MEKESTESARLVHPILVWLLTYVAFMLVLVHFKSYPSYAYDFGDARGYMSAASNIRHGDFCHIRVKQFFGVSYAMVPVSFLAAGSIGVSFLLVCGASSLAAVLLANRLWGPWIAGFFAVLNFDWMQTSFLGGAEPLFIALLFASFLAMRRSRWMLASGLAALATVTRPVGMFALAALAIALLVKREYKKVLSCTVLAALIGALYLLPFWICFHDPLYQEHLYKTNDWQSGLPVGIPFYAIIESFVHNKEPWTNVVLTLAWLLFLLIGTFSMAGRAFREYVREHLVEGLFAFFYIAFLFTYNSLHWARAEFPRFALPALPFVLLSLRRWIPRSQVLLYSLAVVSGVLAACSAIGIRNVFPMLR